MTEKEKAIDLVERFWTTDKIFTKYSKVSTKKAKDCALICVDEIIGYIDRINSQNKYILNRKRWQEVKQEIINLK